VFGDTGFEPVISDNYNSGKIVDVDHKRGFDVRKLLPYVLSYPVSTALVGISLVEHLEENVRVVKDFKPLSQEEMARIQEEAQNRPK
jgi:aryl-alcohol dehydrogenase-like predicted oxidoreductase